MNPKIYCIKNGLKTDDFIAIVKNAAPKYTKSTHCMASDPAYGVQLRASVVRCVLGKTENRSNPCRLTLRCSEAILTRLEAAKEQYSYETNQDILLFALNWFLRETEKAAASAATDTTARDKTLSPSNIHNSSEEVKGACYD